MKKLNFDESAEKLEVTIGGKPFILSYPTWGDVEDVEAKGDDLSTKDVKDFLLARGLTDEAIKICQIGQLRDLYIELIGLKKS